jgi:hypothetical protein
LRLYSACNIELAASCLQYRAGRVKPCQSITADRGKVIDLPNPAAAVRAKLTKDDVRL